MMGLTQASVITLALFIAGLIYHAGQLAERVKQLEQWRAELRADISTIKAGIDECKSMIRGEAV